MHKEHTHTDTHILKAHVWWTCWQTGELMFRSAHVRLDLQTSRCNSEHGLTFTFSPELLKRSQQLRTECSSAQQLCQVYAAGSPPYFHYRLGIINLFCVCVCVHPQTSSLRANTQRLRQWNDALGLKTVTVTFSPANWHFVSLQCSLYTGARTRAHTQCSEITTTLSCF